jgi:hypothetical protein
MVIPSESVISTGMGVAVGIAVGVGVKVGVGVAVNRRVLACASAVFWAFFGVVPAHPVRNVKQRAMSEMCERGLHIMGFLPDDII